jgi:hypothetical protein
MWFSGNNELLLFLFGGASLWCWIKAASRPRYEWILRGAGLLLFALALLSKESAYILLPLFVLAMPSENRRRSLAHLLPYCALAAVMMVSVVATRGHSFRFTDGSFSLRAPVWLTLPEELRKGAVVLGTALGGGDFLHVTRAKGRGFSSQIGSRRTGVDRNRADSL